MAAPVRHLHHHAGYRRQGGRGDAEHEQWQYHPTGRSLDLAINNGGFFTVAQPDGTLAYTRNGQFQVNNQGYVVNNGNFLQGWQADASGNVTQGPVGKLQLNTNLVSPKPTTQATLGLNLDSRKASPTVTPLGRPIRRLTTGRIPIPCTTRWAIRTR